MSIWKLFYRICSIFTIVSICKSDYISLFDDYDYKGEKYYFNVDYNGPCINLPAPWENRTSSVKTGETCIDLYSENNCNRGMRIRLYLGNYNHRNLSKWNFDKILRSVVACEKHINKDNHEVEGNSVSVWDHKDQKGERLNLNVDSCENLPLQWRDRISSASALGKCYMFYADLNCTGTSIKVSPRSADFGSREFDDVTNSIGICKTVPVKNTEENVGVTIENSIDGGLKSETITMISLSIVVIGILASVICGILYFFSNYRKREARMNLVNEHSVQLLNPNYIQAFMKGNVEILNRISAGSADAATIAQHMPYNAEKYEIPFDCLQMDFDCPLGSGEFGIVSRATITSEKFPQMFVVAVKSVKPGAEVAYVKAILDELKIMMYLDKSNHHPHIVNLIGACTQKLDTLEPFIVLEFCKEGSLDKHLRKLRRTFLNLVENGHFISLPPGTPTIPSYQNEQRISTIELLQWSTEIAAGMEFLSTKKVIHGDLACRNVLLDDNMRARISDFGLSRQLYEYTQYVKKQQAPLPWRWMAIESLKDMTFSYQSDVWAFGVTIWEIFTLAETPYPGFMWSPQFINELINGFRLSQPPNATSELFETLLNCWRVEPEDRPTFSQLHRKICTILNRVSPRVTFSTNA